MIRRPSAIVGGGMSAGGSARREAERQRRLADAHQQAAVDARRAFENYLVADRTERSVVRALAPLAELGYHLLPDRAWPGSTRANVDLVVVGPSGLFIVDTKSWAEVSIENDRMFRGQEDVTDEVARLADLAYGAEAALAEIGLAPGEVHALVVLAGRCGVTERSVGSVTVVGELDAAEHISRRGSRLTARQVDAVLARTLIHFPVIGTAAPIDVLLPEPVLDDSDDALFDEQVIGDSLLASVLARPIEEWMSFLAPEQAHLVRRSFAGPARIRGSAGTGKTVVGLHRAAYLARSTPGRVLFATHSTTLPAVLSTLFQQLAPEAAARVEFVSVHRFAARVLRERGIRCSVDSEHADEVFARAWSATGRPGPLGRIDADARYWRDEVRVVIKGRGITSFEQYADLARLGRRRPLSVDQRRAVWELYCSYERGLRERRIHDFPDQLLLAAQSLAETSMAGYSSVIVDEAQDLSASAMRMLACLPSGRRDGLILIGDGQQSIYPGGFALSEIGISLAGRGVVMTTNYRNTAEIVSFASGIVAGDEFTDLEGAPDRADGIAAVLRSGQHPVIRVFSKSSSAHDDAMVQRIRTVLTEDGVGFGDIAVLGLARWQVKTATAALTRAGIDWIDLDDYDGAPVDKVKIGTVKRAKGLEFTQVLLSRVALTLLEPDAATPGDALAERRQLERRELYVAMTRARDGLWVGTVA